MAEGNGGNMRIVDERAGTLQVRVAETAEEVDAAQLLRYRVFYEEMSAKPSPEVARRRRDVDRYDEFADHLLVIDTQLPWPDAVVGTYRLIRRHAAEKAGGFYSAAEYDITKLVAHPGPILELGRSCVDAKHRDRHTMQLMWRGVTTYVLGHQIDFMFGCASLPGIDPKAMALPLSYLYYNHLAPEHIRPVALPDRYVDMRLLEKEAVDAKKAMRLLPPIIKGYLRLGGYVGDGAVIDPEFNTVDVAVVVQTDRVTGKYIKHYTRDHGTEARE